MQPERDRSFDLSTESRIDKDRFIATEPLETSGEAGERLVWNVIRETFADRECIGYWRYPIFSQTGKFRKEPDILIADRELGLLVIEVKSLAIEQIVNITGHRWEYRDFYTNFGNPYQQAENQLFALLNYCDREPLLQGKIRASAIVALPLISESQWHEKGFDRLPSNPPILFKDRLDSVDHVREFIERITPVRAGDRLSSQHWKLFLSLLAGTPVYCQPTHRVLTSQPSRGTIVQKLRSHISEFDLQQEKIAKQIPPGCQRIRGIAGSGKTVLLCQKAAHIHLKHPDWKIAFVFFSRSLYHPIIEQIDRWLRHFSGDRQGYDVHNPNFRIFHAWGSRKQPGLYSFLCQSAGIQPLSANKTQSKKPNEALAEACLHLLQTAAIPEIFDAMLIDEGQDLIVDKFKFEDKQPFYWMAYQSLRPVDSIHAEQRRMIWAYDEGQSLESLKIPNASEIFGENLGHLVTGKYADGIHKSEIINRCYRTPHPVITSAQAIGMGWLRPRGMLMGMTRKEEWEAIGYQVEGSLSIGQAITLKRLRENSPNPLLDFWRESPIEFKIYQFRQQELTALAANLKHNLKYDGLRPSRDILVIILGHIWDAVGLEKEVANFLIRQGIDIFIPGNDRCNQVKSDRETYNPNHFWCEGAVTISRIHRAKGQEADMVYIVGLDNVAKDESNLSLRNQLFIALTRTKAWVTLSGIGTYSMYEEMQRVIRSGDRFTFIFRHPLTREISVTDVGELLNQYALGKRNFQYLDLSNARLRNVDLARANLIGANLVKADLHNARLEEVKLVIADLSEANLSQARLQKAKLTGANLKGANLNGADLTDADLSDADLTEASLENAILINTHLEGTKMPD